MTEARAFLSNEPDQPSPASEDIGSLQDAQFLQKQLSSEFPTFPEPTEGSSAEYPLAGQLSAFASASMRQAKAIQKLVEHVQIAGQLTGDEIAREEIGGLSEAFIGAEVQAKRASDDWESKFKSITDTMAIIGGHFAAQRGSAQHHDEAILELRDEVKRLNEGAEAIRHENAQLRELVQSDHKEMQSNLRDLKESIVLLRDEQENTIRRLTSVETHAASLSEIWQKIDDLDRSAVEFQQTKEFVDGLSNLNAHNGERIELLTNDISSTNGDLASLQKTSEQVAAGLQAVERAVDILNRRGAVLAALHQQTARALDGGEEAEPA